MREQAVDYRAQPIRNLFRRPTGEGLPTTTGQAQRDTTVRVGSALGSARVKKQSEGATSDTFWGPDGDIGAFRSGMEPGKTYTVSGWRYLDSPVETLDGRNIRILAYYRDAGGTYRSIQPATLPTNVAGWYRESNTFTIPATATEAFIRFYNGSADFARAVWWTNAMLTEGTTLHTYADASTPGWWALADGSSVGWPYILESAAGPAFWDHLGVTPGGAGVMVQPPPAMQGRTIFSLVDVVGDIGNYQSWVLWQDNSRGAATGADFRIRVEGNPQAVGAFGAYLNGQRNRAAARTRASFVPGTRHVVAGWIRDDLTSLHSSLDGDSPVNVAMAPTGDGLADLDVVRVTSASGAMAPIRTLLYDRTLTTDERNAVTRWLANAHGVALTV